MVRTLRVGASETPLGRSAPGGPPTPAGSPTFFGESRGKEHQGSALDPVFYGRSFPLAGLGIVGFGTVVGLLLPVC